MFVSIAVRQLSRGTGRITGFDAVLFDLDGVLTPTASLHARAWKQMFDEFLERWSRSTGEVQAPFDIDADYLTYVDGKKRIDGVRGFLQSRGIELSEDETGAGDRLETPSSLGERKNFIVGRMLEQEGVAPYPGSVELLHMLDDAGVAMAVVSSSKNCDRVLEAAGLLGWFEVRVDGAVAQQLGLPGKPAPDTFLEAARRLGVAPSCAVVVEDAIAGVRAGRAGGFGLVVGVDRTGQRDRLMENGAHVVVDDLAELTDRSTR